MFAQRILDHRSVWVVRKHFLSLAFVFGFLTDLFLLNQIDSLVDNLILVFYVVLATVSLLLFYAGVAQRGGERVSHFLEERMPFLMQYSFGGLLSGMLIFYGRSGDFFVSAPFLLLIIAVVVGNEFIVKRSNRLLFHLALYFIGTFAYLVMLVPLLTGYMGDVIFMVSGVMALLLITGVVKLLIRIIPNFVTMQIRPIVFVVGGLYALLNGLYFFNVIPPIPLSLTELHIYHSVEKTAVGSYRILTEDNWWPDLPYLAQSFTPLSGKGAYCFARVYTPVRLHTNIYHRWEYYNDTTGEWEQRFRIHYPISGENKRGYGGYSVSNNLRDGTWRCSVETERGQVLGRRSFTVDLGGNAATLVTRFE
jgi:Protein of unknown function (DUF2914)